MQLPTWVELHLPPFNTPTSEPIWAGCSRCGRKIEFWGPRQEDERALGRFAVWHRRCRDPELVRTAVDAAAAEKAKRLARYGGSSSIVYVRKKG